MRGALRDIGVTVFRSSLYCFTVFGACTYDMVIHKSDIYVFNCNYLCSRLPVHIMGSCSMQALCVADITRSFLTRLQLEPDGFVRIYVPKGYG